MPLFSSKKKAAPAKAKSETKEVAVKAVPLSLISAHNHASVIKRPRITEKAARSAETNTYVFNVAPDANKKSVMLAIKAMYKVTPLRVNITQIMGKNVIVRGKYGKKSGGKKAVVFLARGQTIDIA